MKRFGRDFSITPVEGYICPGMEVPFEVTFSPVELSHELRYDDLPCSIEGAKPIKLTLAGSCILPPVTKEVRLLGNLFNTTHVHNINPKPA